MIKLKNILTEATTSEYASSSQMNEEMKDGKFDPKNPTVSVHGLGVYNLKLLVAPIDAMVVPRDPCLHHKTLALLTFTPYV